MNAKIEKVTDQREKWKKAFHQQRDNYLILKTKHDVLRKECGTQDGKIAFESAHYEGVMVCQRIEEAFRNVVEYWDNKEPNTHQVAVRINEYDGDQEADENGRITVTSIGIKVDKQKYNQAYDASTLEKICWSMDSGPIKMIE